MHKATINFDVICNTPITDQVFITGKTSIKIINIELYSEQYPLWKGDYTFNSVEEALEYDFKIMVHHTDNVERTENKSRKLTLENTHSHHCKIAYLGSGAKLVHHSYRVDPSS